jgi:hypothetical protein
MRLRLSCGQKNMKSQIKGIFQYTLPSLKCAKAPELDISRQKLLYIHSGTNLCYQGESVGTEDIESDNGC